MDKKAPAKPADFVIQGTLQPGTTVITNEAAALGSNAGGGIQVVTTPGSVNITSFTMPY